MSSKSPVRIADRDIGPGELPYVIAEMSANHCGSLEVALELIEAAASAGASAIKVQHYKPEFMTVNSLLPEFRISGGTIWDGKTLYDLYGEAMTPWEWTDELLGHANRHGIHFFSSPFDISAVEFLHSRDVPAFKIASFELVDTPLIRYAASKGRPMILSTGMATEGEIDSAISAVLETGNQQIVLLRCNSSYPAPTNEMDLQTLTDMGRRWPAEIGLSDHTLSSIAAVVAKSFGASVFEKHLTLSRNNRSPDALFSVEPKEFKQYVEDILEAHQAIGEIRYGPSAAEQRSLVFRRSLRASRRIEAGQRLDKNCVASLRPAGGLSPGLLSQIDQFVALKNLEIGEAITDDCIRKA